MPTLERTFEGYQFGLQRLIALLAPNDARLPEAEALGARLLENLADQRTYGDTPENRADRLKILDSLNHFARAVAGSPFLALCNTRAQKTVKAPPLRLSAPFVGPIPLRSETAALFFGRDDEIRRLVAKVQSLDKPVLIVNGLSGSGKTSLLRAGLIPTLDDAGVKSIYCSVLVNPHAELLQAISREIPHEASETPGDLVEALDAITATLGLEWIVLIVDQMEKSFSLAQNDRAQSQQFFVDLARIVQQQTLHPVKLVLAVRSDWLYDFQSVEPSIVDPAWSELLVRIDRLTPEQAHQALTGPLALFGIEWDEEAVGQIIHDLAGASGTVHPPQLQVVGAALFRHMQETTAEGEPLRLTPQTYRALQGVDAILRQHLLNVVATGPDRSACWQVLFRLVGDSDLRVTRREGALRGTLDPAIFARTVRHLEQSAIVVRERALTDDANPDGVYVYTLTHDYLVSEIRRHLEQDHNLQVLRIAEQYLMDGLEDSRNASTRGIAPFLALEHERYQYIWAHRDAMQGLDAEALRLLTLSAVRHGEPTFLDWLSMAQNERRAEIAAEVATYASERADQDDARPCFAVEQAIRTREDHDSRFALRDAFRAEYAATARQAGRASTGPRATRLRREGAARVLWAVGDALPPGERLRLIPVLGAGWARRNRGVLTGGAIGAVLFAVLALGVGFARDRLAGRWLELPPLRAGAIDAMAIAADNPSTPSGASTLYVATPRGRERGETGTVFMRPGDEANWQAVDAESVAFEALKSMVAAPSAEGTRLYVSVLGRGVYRLADDGRAWTPVTRGLHSYFITELAANPNAVGVLYAASAEGNGVFETRDGGDSWANTGGALLVGVPVRSLAYTRFEGGALLAGTEAGQILRRQEGSDEWMQVFLPTGQQAIGVVTALAAEPQEGSVVYAGTSTGIVLLSVDGGLSWQPMAPVSDFYEVFVVHSLAIRPGSPQDVFLSGYGFGGTTLWKYGGETGWIKIGEDQLPHEFFRLLFDPADPNRIYAYGDAGLFSSSDGGQNWQQDRSLDAPLAIVRQIAASPLPNGPVYLAVGGSIYAGNETSNSQWLRGDGLQAEEVRDIEADPQDPRIAYAGVRLMNQWSVYKTSDGGRTWRPAPPPDSLDLALFNDTSAVASAAHDGESVVYAGTIGCGVLVSHDRAETWDLLGRTECALPNAPVAVTDLAIDPTSLRTVYAAGDGNTVYASDDFGRSWSSTRLEQTNQILRLAVDPQVPERLYALTRSDGLWRSDERGREGSWKSVSAELAGRALTALAMTDRAGTLYVAGADGEVWLTTDAGAHWRSVRRDLPVTAIQSMTTRPGAEWLLIGTWARGIFRFDSGRLFYAEGDSN